MGACLRAPVVELKGVGVQPQIRGAQALAVDPIHQQRPVQASQPRIWQLAGKRRAGAARAGLVCGVCDARRHNVDAPAHLHGGRAWRCRRSHSGEVTATAEWRDAEWPRRQGGGYWQGSPEPPCHRFSLLCCDSCWPSAPPPPSSSVPRAPVLFTSALRMKSIVLPDTAPPARCLQSIRNRLHAEA